MGPTPADRVHILTLIRSGALEQAEKAFRLLRAAGMPQDEDHLALEGRMLKARALEASGDARRALFQRAGAAYARAYRETQGSYSGINAATLFSLSGDKPQAEQLARGVLSQCTEDGAAGTPGRASDYYRFATEAEAHLLLGAADKANASMARAAGCPSADADAVASTLHQFDLIARETGQDFAWLDAYRLPGTVHFAGQIWQAGVNPDAEKALQFEVQSALKAMKVGRGYGALAAGADIVIAEAVLAAGAELHVILPAAVQYFEATSVRPYGEAWVARFRALIAQATSLESHAPHEDSSDDLDRDLANVVAMGRARLYAQRYATRAHQILVMTEGRDLAASVTARAGALWRQSGNHQSIFPPIGRAPRPAPANVANTPRSPSAMIFADIANFSAMREGQIPHFVGTVLPALVAAYTGLGAAPLIANSWGDGIFLGYETVSAAAHAAFALRDAFEALDLGGLGLPHNLALRVGAHFGPAHFAQDPVTGAANAYGTEVIFAARIEPATPPGSIYASEAFAAMLNLSAPQTYVCEPAGRKPLRKGLPEKPLYSLRRRGA